MAKNNESLVSIIMPTYNSSDYIKAAINSVFSQTYENWELIIVDDHSTDGSEELIAKLIMNYKNKTKYIKNNKNLGVSKSRNIGIEESKGEWIAFLDSDDAWKESKLLKQFEKVKELNEEFIFTGSSYINEKNEKYSGDFIDIKNMSYKELLRNNSISLSSVLIKKYLLEKNNFENDRVHEDYLLWLKILKTGIKAIAIKEPLLIYRLSKTSKSGNKLKSIRMTYGVYRDLGINIISSIYYTLNHLFKASKKYKEIFNGNKV
ncbi:glycosyl transferase family 2 [Exiguobacterium sp. N4-1P]|uniref:glycosyltransferase family 2 protein n=1 Tax=Exiguobacterium sp. N4-1P TaxID=2051906 RepID=UPI000B595C50|nr:glycosyltransferase family 2 protein [Exiguobacterium sp. N4-1P]ASI36434.1 glycosyl transferase family 2 [Exiguobacterium sp. N4-1P]